MQNPRLWQRLSHFSFDAADGSEPYSVKLAAEEGWSRAYTLRVIEEYRRFLYLTQVGEGQATPSVAVDRAWHMHLTFTRSYWEALCGEVLQKMLHHEPCKGSEDMDRYVQQYRRTIELYEREFGETAPDDIWARAVGQADVLASPGFAGQIALMLAPCFLVIGFIILSDDRPEAALSMFVLSILALVAGLSAWLKAPKAPKGGRRRETNTSGGAGGCGAGGCGGGCGGCGGG